MTLISHGRPPRCGKTLVGDPHRQAHTRRGAVKALKIVTHTHLPPHTDTCKQAATRRRLKAELAESKNVEIQKLSTA